jgi:flagellar hook protein FlgE
MSLFGSLFSGVSALNAQSQAMGIISDNISNVNTVGYKGTSSRFSTLVTSAATETNFTPGGVQARPFALVEQQGLVQSSESATDMAITGQGFFVVNTTTDGTGETLYTRAGSFHQDNLGNLVNTSGLYLEGWSLDPNGLLPGEPGNVTNTTSSADIASLSTINVSSINGVAAATTSIELGANLTATQAVLTGAQDSTIALGVTATQDLGPAIAGLVDGDSFTISDGTGVLGTFTYEATLPLAAGQFQTLTDLSSLINAVSGLTATIGGTAADATLTVTRDDPRETLTVTDATNNAATDLFGTSGVAVADTYDATVSSKNMASGNVSAHFSRPVRVFDAQGTGHDMQMAFLKVDTNTWDVEVYANPASDVTVASPLTDGQIATGTVTFNGDGSLNTVSSGLTGAKSISWTTGASSSSVTLDFGTAGALGTGLTDGLSQFDGAYNVAFVNQNGSEVGELSGVNINVDGYVIASFSNGQTKRIFKLPIATFADVSKLTAKNGNAYAQSDGSGQFNLREAGKGGAGFIAPSALEAANIDIGKQFTDMIITQRAFSASSRVITTVDDMLDELIRIRR